MRVDKPTGAEREYWHHFAPWFGQDQLAEIECTIEDVWIDSAGHSIHLSVFSYPDPEQAAGTIVFSHGIAGHGRLLAEFGLRMMKRGFNVILPDLAGYGFNAGLRGDWTWAQFIQNLCDALDYGGQRFGPRLFLGGASLGGTLAYHAACHRPDLSALACYCLFDYRDKPMLREISRFGALTPLAAQLTRALAAILPHLRIPAEAVITYRHVAEDPAFVALLRRDPLAGMWISLQAVVSMFSAVPAVEFDRLALPTLVLHPEQDRMIPAKWSKKCYAQLTCEKRYVALSGGHWPIFPAQVEAAVEAITGWFLQHGG